MKRQKPPRKGKGARGLTGRISGRQATVQALLQPLRQIRKPRASQESPEAEIMAQDAKWYRLARYDSAIVSMPDGTSAAFYRRDRGQVPRPAQAHHGDPPAPGDREWDDLAEQYRAALPEVTSPEAWEKTFGPWLEAHRRQ